MTVTTVKAEVPVKHELDEVKTIEPQAKAAQLIKAPEEVQRLVLALRIGLNYIQHMNVEQFLALRDLSDQELVAELDKIKITESTKTRDKDF